MSIKEVNSFVEMAYEYLKEVSKCDPEREAGIQEGDLFSGGKNLTNAMFAFIIEYKQKNGFPTILEDKEYEKLNEEEIYHGFTEYDYGAETLMHWKYHYGLGYTNGLYFTPKLISNNRVSYSTLKFYRELLDNNDLNQAPEKERAILDEIRVFIENKNKNGNARDRLFMIDFLSAISHPSTLGAILGYDYIDHQGYKIVLNRGIIAVSESEYNKFKNNSKRFCNYEQNEQ